MATSPPRQLPPLPVDVILGRVPEEHSRQPIYRSGPQPTIETYLREYVAKVKKLPQNKRTKHALKLAETSCSLRDLEQMKFALEELVNISRGLAWG